MSPLLYCLGEQSEDVLTSTDISEESRKKYKEDIRKLVAFFEVRKNVMFERARFNRRSRRPDESAAQYITSLYSLADNCQFGAMKDERVRDRLVVGIQDSALSEKLQMDADLSLDKAKKAIRQREAVHKQQGILEHTKEDLSAVNFVGKQKNHQRGTRQPQRASPSSQRTK